MPVHIMPGGVVQLTEDGSIPETFDECVAATELAIEAVQKHFQENGYVFAHVIVFCSRGPLLALMPPGRSKPELRDIQQSLVDTLEGYAIAVFDEAYSAPVKTRAEAEKWAGRIKDHPQCEEIIMISFEHRKGVGTWKVPIKKDRSLGEVERVVGEGTSLGGLFSGWVRPSADAN